LPGDEGGLLGGEPQHRVTNILGVKVAPDRLTSNKDLERALALLAEELSGAFGKHRRWRNAVDANVVVTEFAREARVNPITAAFDTV